MRATPMVHYIWAGTTVRFLQDAKAGVEIFAKGYIIDNIDNFFKHLEAIGLPVTERASYKLRDFKEQLISNPEKDRLDGKNATELQQIMEEIRHTFDAESYGVTAYTVTDKRFKANILSEDIGKLFRPGAYTKCPEIGQYDLQEAGLCILYERPTAAAFHILRATEALLREYYKYYIRPYKDGLTWGGMEAALKQKTRGRKPHPPTLQNLTILRNNFRNPTDHPDMVYDIHEVQDLLGLVIDVINRMTSEIKTKVAKKKAKKKKK